MPIETLEPIPGDPEAIAAAARKLHAVAAEVEATSARLRALASHDSSWSGQAATRARARAITLPPKLEKVRDSYATAGAALRRYATALHEAQADATAARHTATRAAADLHHARAAHEAAAAHDSQAVSTAAAAGLPAPTPTATRYESHITDAETRLHRATAANTAAHDQQHRAARTAAATLHQASRDGIANKPWWRHAISAAAHWAQHTWTDSLRKIAKAALAISAMAGLAALAVTLTGAAFPPLELAAGALESISIASGAITVITQTALAATGNAPWKAVAIDALAVIPALGAASTRLFTTRLSSGRLAALDGDMADVETALPQHLPPAETTTSPEIDTADVWANPSTLKRHFTDHGADFGANSEVEYANRAATFFQESKRRRLPTKIDLDGTIRIYDPASNTFGSYNRLGRTRTFFKPKSSTYWQRQRGTSIEDFTR